MVLPKPVQKNNSPEKSKLNSDFTESLAIEILSPQINKLYSLFTIKSNRLLPGNIVRSGV